jgi:hypothetical protein
MSISINFKKCNKPQVVIYNTSDVESDSSDSDTEYDPRDSESEDGSETEDDPEPYYGEGFRVYFDSHKDRKFFMKAFGFST